MDAAKVQQMETVLLTPNDAQRSLLQKKNALLNVLGTDGGGNIVVCGDTSVGKSTVINFLLGFPLNLEAQGVGTRRPCILSQVCDPNAEIVHFRAVFEDQEIRTGDMKTVAEFVADANRKAGDSFDSEPVFVEMHHRSNTLAMRFVDLPGLIHPSRPNAKVVQDLAMKYLKPDNTVVVVLGRDNWTNGGTFLLCERIKTAKKVIFAQNFAYNEWQIRAAQQRMSDVRGSMATTFDYVLIDMGTVGPGSEWNQKDWKKMSDEVDASAVTQAMADHNEKWRQRIRSEYAADLAQTDRVYCGIRFVQNQLVTFSLDGLEVIINSMVGKIKDKIVREEAREKELTKEVEVLQNTPPAWQELLDGVAGNLAKYFDTTLSQVDFAAGREPGGHKSCMKTDKEMKAGGMEPWYPKNGAFDTNMVKLLDGVSREYNPGDEIACLRSWYRLLDEFTGALCFASMRKIDKHELHATKMQFQQHGQRFEVALEDRILQLLSTTDKKRIFIDDMLRKFQKRLMLLVKRDIEDAVKVLEQDRDGYFPRLAEALGKRDYTQLKKHLLESISRETLAHAESVLKEDIDVLCQRRGEKGAEGILEWLYPFKRHYLNGQLPWKLLGKDLAAAMAAEDGAEGESVGAAGAPVAGADPILIRAINADQVDINSTITMAEDHINATNHVNLIMFQLATEVYDVKVDKSTPEKEHESYTIEVLKLLQMMQGEMSTFVLKETQEIMRGIGDPHKIKAMCAATLDDKGIPETIAANRDAVDNALIALLNFIFDTEHGYLVSRIGGPEGLTSEQEMDRAKNDPPPGCPREFACWPTIKEEEYTKWLTEEGQIESREESFFGKAAWARLSEEFVAVNMMLTTKSVHQSELVMAQASAGHSLYAGTNEIVEKLTMHRMEEISVNTGDVYHLRLMTIYSRDIHCACDTWVQNNASIPNAKEVAQWVSSPDSPVFSMTNAYLVHFKAKMQLKFKELFPFDFSTMNGRFPFREVESLSEPGETIKELASSCLFPAVVPSLTDGVEEVSGQVTVKKQIRTWAKTYLTSPPPVPLLDDERTFNDWALKYFKAIHATAVDHCRPKLKKTMSKMYQPEELRKALVHALKFSDFFGEVKSQKQEELRRCSVALEQMTKEFDLAIKGQLASSIKTEEQEWDEKNRAMRKELEQASAELKERRNSAQAMKMLVAAQMQAKTNTVAKLSAAEAQSAEDMEAVKQVMKLLGADGEDVNVQALVPKVQQIVKSLGKCEQMAHQAIAYNRIERLSSFHTLHLQELQVNLVGTDVLKCGVLGYKCHFPGLPVGEYTKEKPPTPNFAEDSSASMRFLESSHLKQPPLFLWQQNELPRMPVPNVNPVDEHCLIFDVYAGWQEGVMSKKWEKVFSVRLPLMYAYKTHANSFKEINKGLPGRGTLPDSAAFGFKTDVEATGPLHVVLFTFKPESFMNVNPHFAAKLGACEVRAKLMHKGLDQ